MDYVDTKGAVKYLSEQGIEFTKGTLSVWRSIGKGPRFKKIMSKVYYATEALDEFARGESKEAY